MKKWIALALTAVLTFSVAACGGGGESAAASDSPVQSKGLFLMEREEGVELDDLTAQETYLIHVYDIIPDKDKNVEMSPFESHYSITMNEANTYESLYTKKDYKGANNVQYFQLACGYVAPNELETILAGGEPIRAVSVYKINRNDIKDDTTAVFTIENCDVLNCEVAFDKEDIIPIKHFDDVFQIEENAEDYQMAAAYYQRTRTICNNLVSGTMFNKLFSNGLTSYKNCLDVVGSFAKHCIYSVTQMEGLTKEFAGEEYVETGFSPMDTEAVKRVYPDLPVDEFEEAIDSWITNGQAFLKDNSNKEAGEKADAAVESMKLYGDRILKYYEAKHLNQ